MWELKLNAYTYWVNIAVEYPRLKGSENSQSGHGDHTNNNCNFFCYIDRTWNSLPILPLTECMTVASSAMPIKHNIMSKCRCWSVVIIKRITHIFLKLQFWISSIKYMRQLSTLKSLLQAAYYSWDMSPWLSPDNSQDGRYKKRDSKF